MKAFSKSYQKCSDGELVSIMRRAIALKNYILWMSIFLVVCGIFVFFGKQDFDVAMKIFGPAIILFAFNRNIEVFHEYLIRHGHGDKFSGVLIPSWLTLIFMALFGFFVLVMIVLILSSPA